MKRATVFGFPRTIYQLRKSSPGFLNPWSSLRPSFLQRKIAPEILGVFRFRKKKLIFEPFFRVKGKFVDPAQVDNHWVLVFPKRSYLPFAYPHFQLWIISRRYIPSPRFMRKGEIEILTLISRQILEVYREYSLSQKKKGTIVFGYNSTPFSFIKDDSGRYYAGGQSVRALHFHWLLVPRPKKYQVNQKQLSLIYPTSFSFSLLKLVFNNPKIRKKIGFSSGDLVREGKRGVEIVGFGTERRELRRFWQTIKKMDNLLYQLQELLILSFYRDAGKLVKRVRGLEKDRDVSKAEKVLKKLIIVGEEYPLAKIKGLLSTGLVKLARRYGAEFKEKDLEHLLDQLIVNKKGDLASFVFGEKVVLRPGMGYGVLVKKIPSGKLMLMINPLDVLGSKGLIESSGYWFAKKIVKKDYPPWAILIVNQLIKRLKK